jgi:uncharacterized protein (UPF0261 family)
VEDMPPSEAEDWAAEHLDVSPSTLKKTKRAIERDPTAKARIESGQSTPNKEAVEDRKRRNRLAIVKMRVSAITSATKLLQAAITSDMQDARHADVVELNKICETILEDAAKASQIVKAYES